MSILFFQASFVCVTSVDFQYFMTFYPFLKPLSKNLIKLRVSLYLYHNTCICGIYEFCYCLQMKDMTCEELVKEVAKM